MSEIQNIADAAFVKLLIIIVGGCVGLINLLGFFILGRIKKTTDKLWSRFNRDHERLDILEAEHKVFHKEETGINS